MDRQVSGIPFDQKPRARRRSPTSPPLSTVRSPVLRLTRHRYPHSVFRTRFNFFHQTLPYPPESTIGPATDSSAIGTGGVEQVKETFGHGRVPGRRPWHSECRLTARSAQVSDLAASIDRQVSGIPFDQTPLPALGSGQQLRTTGSAFPYDSPTSARINHRAGDRHFGHRNGRDRASKGDLRSRTCAGSETLAQRVPFDRALGAGLRPRRFYRPSGLRYSA
jgi:hypothetical protein